MCAPRVGTEGISSFCAEVCKLHLRETSAEHEAAAGITDQRITNADQSEQGLVRM